MCLFNTVVPKPDCLNYPVETTLVPTVYQEIIFQIHYDFNVNPKYYSLI